MKCLLSISIFILIITNLNAQDRKLKSLYNNKKYCKCIERYDKLSSKKKSPYDLYYRAVAYFMLHLEPDPKCDIKNPFSKSINAIVRLQNHKGADAVIELNTLKENIFLSGIKLYNTAIEENKWVKAIQIIEQLKEVEEKPLFLMTQAYCEYNNSNPLAFYNVQKAIRYQIQNNKKDEKDFIQITQKLLFYLDSTRNDEFQPLMDLVLSHFSDNDKLANTIFKLWKRDIVNYREKEEYSHLFNSVGIIFKHYPNKTEWKNEVTSIILNIADSIIEQYNSDKSRVEEIFKCCNFLTKARCTLPEDIKNELKKATYYNVSLFDDRIRFSIDTRSANIENEIKFKLSNRNTVSIIFNSVVPKEELTRIKGFIWNSVPPKNRAKKPSDIVKFETMNTFLLDSLCGVYCNKFRTENGKLPLEWHTDIFRASKHHASTMACLGTIFHGEEDELIYGHSDSVQMYNLYSSTKKFNCTGENVLYNFAPRRKMSYEEMAQQIINQWIDSPGHKANMLKDDFKFGTVGTCITSYHGQFAIFQDKSLIVKYFPEIQKLLEIFPALNSEIITSNPLCFASQNFACQ